MVMSRNWLSRRACSCWKGGGPTPAADYRRRWRFGCVGVIALPKRCRSEEHTSELQSLMRISYAVFCLKKKKKKKFIHSITKFYADNNQLIISTDDDYMRHANVTKLKKHKITSQRIDR